MSTTEDFTATIGDILEPEAEAATPQPREGDWVDLTDFERELRRDRRLNPGGRLAWLMVAVSHKNGTCNASAAWLAEQLGGCSTDTVRAGRKALVALGLFKQIGKPAEKRPPKYARCAAPAPFKIKGVSHTRAFTEWVRYRRELDLTVRVAWLLCHLASTPRGFAEISLAEMARQLDTSPPHLARSLKLLVQYGLFRRTRGGGRGKLTRYTPITAVRYYEATSEEPAATAPENLSEFIESQIKEREKCLKQNRRR